jgi:predicted nucleic acid-binding protein
LSRASLHSETDPLPPALAVDTSFLVKALNHRDPQQMRAHALYERLVTEGTVCAFCEPILRLEFWAAWSKAVGDLSPTGLQELAREVREMLTGQHELGLFSALPRSPSEERSRRLDEGEKLFEMMLSPLRITRVRLTRALLARARKQIVGWGLKPLDAVVAGVAGSIADAVGGPPHVVTMDTDFGKVDGLHVWGLSP